MTKTDGPQLACADCHAHADKSSHATIPNTETCMVCHESILNESPEIQKLAAYSKRGEQPPWVRVYAIDPEAKVFFTHKPHIRAGVDCAACHGQVAQSRRVGQEVKQTMGWCIQCHVERRVSTDCYTCHR